MSPDNRPKAVLVGVKLPAADELEFSASLLELERLVTTLGYQVAARVTQARTNLAPAAVLGEGKLAELAELTGGSGDTQRARPKPHKAQRKRRESELERPEPDTSDAELEPKIALVAVDHDVSPTQLRNLERATGSDVLDRTGVIIEIFHRHAKSRAARLQVEIARLGYEAPRLRESTRGKERQHFRGSGDAALELDRRRIRDRIAELKGELESVEREQRIRRGKRQGTRRVALVGYTNAGKSSLMRALTGSDVYVEDKLFATLDTTVRALEPEAKPRILISDTVGFIKKLPHDLVASFKSTLDEALEASLLLYIVDASDPSFRDQLQVVRQVLGEIGALDVPAQLVMNKIDRLSPGELAELEVEQPDAWFISARQPEDVRATRQRIIQFFEARYAEAELVVPYTEQRLVSEMHERGRVVSERYEGDGVRVVLQSDPESLDSFRARLDRAATRSP
jgi:GTP-binding protein HflX